MPNTTNRKNIKSSYPIMFDRIIEYIVMLTMLRAFFDAYFLNYIFLLYLNKDLLACIMSKTSNPKNIT